MGSGPGEEGSVAFSAGAWVRAAGLLRREVAGFFSCSWLTVVAFSGFWRGVRLREIVGFACSRVSGDSDVFFMKKTPFCILVHPII
jgi:hypothetical protein